MANYITLGLNIFCGVLILFGVLWGIIRGVKKTSVRLFFLLLTTVILLFVTIPITNLILKIPVTTNFVSTSGEQITETMTLLELLTYFIKQFIGEDFVTKYPEFASAIASLPILLINAFVYVILFWLSKYIFLPLNYLIYRLISIKRKPKEEMLGFANIDNDENELEYRSSDRKIDPLLEVYKESQKQSEKQDAGVFIKKDNQMDMSAPQGTSKAQTTKGDNTPPQKQQLKQSQKQQKQDKKTDRAEKKEQRAEKKAEKKLLKSDAPKKYRLWGGLVGLVVGVLVMFNTFIPIYGVMNILEKYNHVEITKLTNSPTSINSITDGISGNIVKGYELSAIGRLSKFLGLSALGEKGFDQLTSTKINGKKVVLREDLDSLCNALVEVDSLYGQYLTISENGLENITQEQLDSLIQGTEKIIASCQQTEFVDAMSVYIIPIAYEILIENDIKIVENEAINQLILDTVYSLANNSNVNVFGELNGLLDLAKYLNEEKILLHIVSNNYDNIFDTINNLDENFETTFTSKIFAIKTIDSTLPNILDIGLHMFDDMVNFGYVENDATQEQLKDSFSQLITNLISTARTLSEDNTIYLTDQSLVPLGKTLDTLRNSHLFNIQTYNNLVDYAINQIKLRTQDIVPATFTSVFNNQLLRNVSKVESWQKEMQIISETLTILRDKEYGILGNVQENEEYRVGYSTAFELSEGTLINLGKAFDKLETSILLGTMYTTDISSEQYDNATLTNTLVAFINEIYNQINNDSTSDETTKDIISLAVNIQENIIKASHPLDNSTFWQDEMTAIAPLVININNILSSDDITFGDDLGQSLDTCAHNSVLLGNNTTLLLMEKLVNIIKDSVLPQDYQPAEDNSLNDNIYYMLEGLRENLTSDITAETLANTPNFWQNEMVCFDALIDIADQAESISTISSANAIAPQLDQVYLSNIIPVTQFNTTINSVLKQLKTDNATEGSVTAEINTLIDNIANDITQQSFWNTTVIEKDNFWQVELEHIASLDTIELDGNNILNNLSAIGITLDNIAFGNENIRASYLITEMRIRSILSSSITTVKTSMAPSISNENIKSAIENATDSIATNIANEEILIESFSTELTFLKSLSEIEIDASIFSQYSSTMTPEEELSWQNDINTKLASISSVLDNIGYNTIEDENIIIFDDTQNSKWITRNILGNIMSSVFASATICGEGLSSIETSFNQLVSDIQDTINTTTNNNQVITWTRELSYVPFLIKLNTNATIDIDNITSHITSNIDKIAFNEKYTNDVPSGVFADTLYNAQYQIIGEYATTYTSDTTTYFYNSVLITRTMLTTLMTTALSDLKIDTTPLSSEDEIVNELIDNCQNINYDYNPINTTSLATSKFNSFTTALNELNNAKEIISNMGDSLNGKNINEINLEMMQGIDQSLSNLQNSLISGVITTRKIALLVLEHAQTILTASSIPLDSSTGGQYLTSLTTYYNNNIASASAEIYYNNPDDSGNNIDNPMAKLYTLLTTNLD